MQEKAFREYLVARGLDEKTVNQQVEAIRKVEAQLQSQVPGWTLEDLNHTSGQELVDGLIERGENTMDNLLALVRYTKVIDNRELFVAIFHLLDGYEVMDNLYSKLGDAVGEDLRDGIFENLPLPPLGLSRYEKAHYTAKIMDRMEEIFGISTTRDLLQDCLRDLPDEYYPDEKTDFYDICEGDMDRYLVYRGEKFVDLLRGYQERNELFFGQEITDEVIAFVEGNPEIGGGVREGNLIYETKIPYNAKEYLAATDPEKKRYHFCHCPWAKESIRKPNLTVSPTFCQCSAGFVKKPFDVIFGQNLQADVLESVLKGDPVCRFAIHLPEEWG
ncbi:hypothetical protein JR338_13055 (plasmid) [Chloroflexota bacterium]|nr:hypothetical protein JR338_13055 [Chloroflexota bacterium]